MSFDSLKYQREWRANNPEKVALYNATSKSKRGPEYWRVATAKWRKEHPDEYRLQRQKRRKRMVGVKIIKEDIHNWYTRICGICILPIEGEFHFDHIIPLSRDGEHKTENLQLAHPFCNLSKFTKLPSEMLVV